MKPLIKAVPVLATVALLLAACTLAASPETESMGEPTPGSTGAAWEPLSPELCAALAQAASQALGMDISRAQAPFSDPSGSASGTGCQATATGTGKSFQSPQAAVDALASALEGQGWQEDQQFAAGGPTGMATGFRNGDQVCLAAANWQPSPDADCPQDQPIASCQLEPEQQLYTVTLNCAMGGGN